MYSVLMSVYVKENPEYLRESIMSILQQTLPTDDFVLVCDGPLTPALDQTISYFETNYSNIFHIVRLEKNMGLGGALNQGMQHCKHSLIARMDSDDIARSNRCQLQYEFFMEHPEIDMVSGTVEEFSSSPQEVTSRRVLPEHHEDILRFAKKRCPFNHPCIMYRKEAVLAAGGYQHFFLLEDYFLWVRMLISGCKSYNFQVPLLWMRAGAGMYQRRGGIKYAKSQVALLRYMKEHAFINSLEFITGATIRTLSSVAPAGLRKLGYSLFLRKK